MGYALSTANMSYEPFQRVERGGAGQISEIQKETPVIPLQRQVEMTGAGFKDMLNTTVSTQAFKIANDNKKHYEALCRRIQLNKQQMEMPKVEAQAQPQPEFKQPQSVPATEGDEQADIEPQVAETQIEPDVKAEADVELQQDTAARQEIELERSIAETREELKIIYAYMAEQEFEAEQAQDFLKYVVHEQATQFVAAPQQGVQAAPKMNFVAIDAMGQAIAQGKLPLEQHAHKDMFRLNAMEMAQPVAAGQPEAAPVGKLDAQIEKQLQTIAAGNQFDAGIVQEAAELQVSAPEQNGAIAGNPVDAPIAQTSGPDNTDKALALIDKAKKQNAEAEIIRLNSSNDVYFREQHIQVLTVTGQKMNITSFAAKSTRFDAEKRIVAEAGGSDLNMEQQRLRFDHIARDMKENYQSRIEQQSNELREQKGIQHASVIATGSGTRVYEATAKRESAGAMLENQDSMLASSKNILKDVAAAPDMSLNIR